MPRLYVLLTQVAAGGEAVGGWKVHGVYTERWQAEDEFDRLWEWDQLYVRLRVLRGDDDLGFTTDVAGVGYREDEPCQST